MAHSPLAPPWAEASLARSPWRLPRFARLAAKPRARQGGLAHRKQSCRAGFTRLGGFCFRTPSLRIQRFFSIAAQFLYPSSGTRFRRALRLPPSLSASLRLRRNKKASASQAAQIFSFFNKSFSAGGGEKGSKALLKQAPSSGYVSLSAKQQTPPPTQAVFVLRLQPFGFPLLALKASFP